MLDLFLLSITYQFFDIKDRITYHAQTMHTKPKLLSIIIFNYGGEGAGK